MKYAERRSVASRFFRWAMRPFVQRLSVVAMGVGLGLVLWSTDALPAGLEPQHAQSLGGGNGNAAPEWVGVAGGAVLFMAIFAGISRWVADPAARKAVSDHEKRDANPHPQYVSREEWDRKHLELVEATREISNRLERLIGEIRRRSESGERPKA